MDQEKSSVSTDPIVSDRLTGSIRAFHGVKDGFVILHSPPGCHSGLMYLRALYDSSDVRLVFTCMHARHLVFGADYLALETIKYVYKLFKPKFIALVDSVAPAMIGDDLDSVVKIAKKQGVNCPIIHFCGAGFYSSMQEGYEDAAESLVQFMKKSSQESRTINLVGFHPDEPRHEQDLNEIRRILKAMGIKLNSVLVSSSFNKIRAAPRASLNVVLGGEGFKLAKRMEEEFGIPYIVVDYPYGLYGTEEFIQTICREFGRRVDDSFLSNEKSKIRRAVERTQFYLQGIYGLPCSIIGDTCKATSLAKFLRSELGFIVNFLVITSKNYLYDDIIGNVGYVENLLIEPDRFVMEGKLKESDSQILFGSTFDKRLANIMKIPLIRFSFPTIDYVALTNAPYAGFRGVVKWIETILNSILRKYHEAYEK